MSSGVGGVLTSGIQDISALLPLLGTEQCEDHLGAGLTNGFLYPAASPLSIFGSLGIAKGGFKVLVASITSGYLGLSGARKLKDSGFGGSKDAIASISLDETGRYKAETELLLMMETRNLDNPDKLTVKGSNALAWNTQMICYTTVFSLISTTPYIYLNLHGDVQQRAVTKLFFPIARALGSFLVVVFSQILLQHRILTIVRNRLIFMTVDRQLEEHDVKREKNLKDWSTEKPSDECLWCLQKFLDSVNSTKSSDERSTIRRLLCIAKDIRAWTIKSFRSWFSRERSRQETHCEAGESVQVDSGPQMFPLPETNSVIELQGAQSQKSDTKSEVSNVSDRTQPVAGEITESQSGHSNAQSLDLDTEPARPIVPDQNQPVVAEMTNARQLKLKESLMILNSKHHDDGHFYFVALCRVVMGLGIGLSVAGYIGCFSLVQASTRHLAPLVWLGLEASLSIIRMVLWGLNPEWDDRTGVDCSLNLSEHRPLPTCNLFADELDEDESIPLMIEQDFLREITSYVGPVIEPLPIHNKVTLFYTLTQESSMNPTPRLYLTILDMEGRNTFTWYRNPIPSRKITAQGEFVLREATLFLTQVRYAVMGKVTSMEVNHITQDQDLMTTLAAHYDTILFMLNRPLHSKPLMVLSLKWLVGKSPQAVEAHITEPARGMGEEGQLGEIDTPGMMLTMDIEIAALNLNL